jgi:putative FmdB family regulatory protein
LSFMPTYEYYCSDCGFEFEEFQSIASEPLTVCPKCDGKVKRKISGGTGLIFKGSGFYITDYKNNKSSKATPEKKSESKEKDIKTS